MPSKEKPNRTVSDNADTLLDQITREQEKINRHEGDVVASQVFIAHCLVRLRMLASKGEWGQRLQMLGFSPRVARRYLKIGRDWPQDSGLNESAMLPRLPPDLLKLEWLCRVPLDQLAEVLDKVNCKRASRSEVIAAVREALGEETEATAELDVESFVRRLVRHVSSGLERLDEEFPKPEDQTRARELIKLELQQLLTTL